MKQKIRKRNKYRVNLELLRLRNEIIQYWNDINQACNKVMSQMFGGFLSSLTYSPTDMYYEFGLYQALQQIPYHIKKRR